MVKKSTKKNSRKSPKRKNIKRVGGLKIQLGGAKKQFRSPACQPIGKLDPLPLVLLDANKPPTVKQYLRAVCQATGAIQLGRGGYGIVNRYCIPELNVVVAGKRGFAGEELGIHLMVTLCQLNKPSLDWFAVPLIDVVKCSNGTVIVMPMYPKTLTAHLTELISVGKVNDAAHMINKTFAALDRLHRECGVVHWDFKTDNVLVTYSGDPHISDFGLSWSLDELVNPDDANFLLPTEYFFFIEDMVRNSPHLAKHLLPVMLDLLKMQGTISEDIMTFEQLIMLWKIRHSRGAKSKKYIRLRKRLPFEDAYTDAPPELREGKKQIASPRPRSSIGSVASITPNFSPVFSE